MLSQVKQAAANVTCTVFQNLDPRAAIMLTVFSTPIIGLWILGSALFPVAQ